MYKFLAIIGISLLSSNAPAQTIKEPPGQPEWSRPYTPFRIVGNLYYVGTYDLACYLITTSKGNILINTGLSGSDLMIKKNIESLGFKFSDIKILLTTQAHFDHTGALAAVKKATGAKMFVNEKDAAVLTDGGKSDYEFGGKESSFVPVKPDRLLHDGEAIELGEMKLVLLHHPGHTKGSSSFIFEVKDNNKTYKVLIANMPSIIVNKPFAEVTAYPTIQQDYAYTFAALKKLSFDIWLSSHASQFGLHTKHKPGEAYNPAAFIDRSGYDKVVLDLEKQFDKKIAAK